VRIKATLSAIAIIMVLALGASTALGATLTLTPNNGPTGTAVTAEGAGFSSRVFGTLTSGGQLLGRWRAGSNRQWTLQFTWPAGFANGPRTVVARTNAGTQEANATFTVTRDQPSPPPALGATLTLTPNNGPTGTAVTAEGAGFSRRVFGTLTSGGQLLGRWRAGSNRQWTLQFTWPAGFANGPQTVVARTNAGTQPANATFTVTRDQPSPYQTARADGGATPYAGFTGAPSGGTSFFPLSVWGAYNHTPANIAIDKSVGLNGYVWFADASTAGALANARNAGMWAITDKNDAAGLLGSGTLGRLTEDEYDMRCGPSAACYQDVENTISSFPNDGRAIYANYGKGVLLWETVAEAQRWINGTSTFGEYQDFVSTDLYWFTDPNQRTMQAEHWLPEGANGEVTLTRNQVERASNYGYQVDYLRQLDAMDGVRQPIWNFVEVGCPWSECGGDFDAIKPAEVRAAVWHSLIAGARGIVYFQHTFAGPSGCITHHVLRDGQACYAAVRRAVTDLNTQINSLAPVLNAPTVTSGMSASASVRAMGKLHDGALYIFAGSKNNTSSTAVFNVSSGTTAEVVGENRSIPISATGRFSDSFADGNAVHIYRVR
jgi:hypothetical protein